MKHRIYGRKLVNHETHTKRYIQSGPGDYRLQRNGMAVLLLQNCRMQQSGTVALHSHLRNAKSIFIPLASRKENTGIYLQDIHGRDKPGRL